MPAKTVDKELNKRQAEAHRASIKTGALLSILDQNAKGTLKNKNGESYELSSGRLKSIEMLINKSLPALQSIEQSFHEIPDNPEDIERQWNQALVDAIKSMDQETIEALRESDTADIQ